MNDETGQIQELAARYLRLSKLVHQPDLADLIREIADKLSTLARAGGRSAGNEVGMIASEPPEQPAGTHITCGRAGDTVPYHNASCTRRSPGETRPT